GNESNEQRSRGGKDMDLSKALRPPGRRFGVLIALLCLSGSAPAFVHSLTGREIAYRPQPGPSRPAQNNGRQAERNIDVVQLTQSVLDRLIAIAPVGDKYAAWPPRIEVITGDGSSQGFEGVGKYNAFASAPRCIPMIGITDGLLRDLIENDSDRL